MSAFEILRTRNVMSKGGLCGLTRVRNESLVFQDTLDHMANIVDYIYVFDDCSSDGTVDIAYSHPSVISIIRNKIWLPEVESRLNAETQHRRILCQMAKLRSKPEWFLYLDADERVLGDVRGALYRCKAHGIRINLFDAYMTTDDCRDYVQGESLLDFRRKFGPEMRKILMMWRAEHAYFRGSDCREPVVVGDVVDSEIFCQHYGKSMSVQQWEETCEYYVRHFPWEPYGKKWSARKGKAIHNQSDFGRPLFDWGKELFENAVQI